MGDGAGSGQGKSSFWRYFFKSKPAKVKRTLMPQTGTSLEDEMATIQERTETSEQNEGQSARTSLRFLDFIRKPFQLQMRKSRRHAQNSS